MAYFKNVSRVARNAEASMRSAICRRLQQLNISYYKHTSTGVLQSKALRDVEAVNQMVRLLIDTGLSTTITVTVALAVTAIRAPYFLPVYLLVIPPVALVRALLSSQIRKTNRGFRKEFEGMSSSIMSMIDMIPIARAHAVEESEIEKIDQKLDEVRTAGLKLDFNNSLFNSLSWVCFTLLNVGGLLAAAWICYKHIFPLGPGDVVLLSGYFASISAAVLSIANTLPIISRGMESIRSIGEILESPDVEHNRGKQSPRTVGGAFSLQNVEYTYPESEAPAVQNMTLDVPAGHTLAMVGPSGSGKSTVMGLILGFQRPTGGRILLDGRNMNDLDLRSYRRHLAVVTQDTHLFQGTLRDNVLYGAEGVTEKDLIQAIKDSNAWEFVQDLPDGLDTTIGERGGRLSGGQKQQIAIARAIIRDPKVLILDEATSALDVEAEFLVQEALDRLMKNRTTFVVAHRLSTIRSADLIVVLEQGRIAERGTLADLLALDGAFAAAYRLQTGGLDPAAAAI